MQSKGPSRTGSKTTTDQAISRLVADARLIESLKRHVEKRDNKKETTKLGAK